MRRLCSIFFRALDFMIPRLPRRANPYWSLANVAQGRDRLWIGACTASRRHRRLLARHFISQRSKHALPEYITHMDQL